MANLRQIKRRIKSATNISKITYAMQMVAASKMKKAQAAALSGRPYTKEIEVATMSLATPHPLTITNNSTKDLIILISTSKGLCGGLNTQLFKKVTSTFTNLPAFISVGKKGENFVIRSGSQLIADFSFNSSSSSLAKLAIDYYLSGSYSHIYLAYNNFVNSLKQEPIIKQLLPLEIPTSTKNSDPNFIIEPSKTVVIDNLYKAYVDSEIRAALRESEASEYSSRMVTMKSATDNARDLIGGLTLEYNKVRQEKITSEILDIVTARISNA